MCTKSVNIPARPNERYYTRTSFSDYLGTGPTLRRKCACGATMSYQRKLTKNPHENVPKVEASYFSETHFYEVDAKAEALSNLVTQI